MSVNIPPSFYDGCMKASDIYYIKAGLYFLTHERTDVPTVADTLQISENDVLRIARYWETYGFSFLDECSTTLEDNIENEYIAFVKTRFHRELSAEEEKMIKNIRMSLDIYKCLVDFLTAVGFTSSRRFMECFLLWTTRRHPFENVDETKDYCVHVLRTSAVIHDYLYGGKKILTQSEFVLIDKWITEFKFNEDIIKEACERSLLYTNSPNTMYINSVLQSWVSNNIRTLDDIKNMPVPKKEAKKNAFTNFTQTSYSDELDELEKLFHKEVNGKKDT